MSNSVTEAEEKRVAEPGFFDIQNTTRAIKRLKPDPVPAELIHNVLDAATKDYASGGAPTKTGSSNRVTHTRGGSCPSRRFGTHSKLPALSRCRSLLRL